jgi:outer membrane lipoprotein-sorting protein
MLLRFRTVFPLACLSFVLGCVFASIPATAAPPDAVEVIQRMKDALEPTRPSTRKVVFSVKGPQGEETQWVAGKAFKPLADGKRTLIVLLEPEDLKGTALLIWERAGEADAKWLYMPPLPRVRKIIPVNADEHFLNTDFTYADLGFVSRRGTYRFLGEEKLAGIRAYKIEEVPHDQWYYSRIITWVAAGSMLPLQRDSYDRAGVLWKTEVFENVTVIDGVPTPLVMRMQDRQAGTSTELRVSEVRYDVDIPDDFFTPERLPQAATSPLWQGYGARVAER